MSRVGKKVIKIPKDVSVVITDKTVNVKVCLITLKIQGI